MPIVSSKINCRSWCPIITVYGGNCLTLDSGTEFLLTSAKITVYSGYCLTLDSGTEKVLLVG